MSVLHDLRPHFRAIATTIVPEAGLLGDAGWLELESIVEGALASRPARLRRQIRILIRALTFLPLLRYGRPFAALTDHQRADFLTKIENSPVSLVRRGFWGFRTLVFMGFYARPAAGAEIGYRASARGWNSAPASSAVELVAARQRDRDIVS